MAKQPKVVYGGPYANETDAITQESLKKKPDFTGLIKDWETISTGAQAYIEQVQKPVEVPVGEFVVNYKEKEDKEVTIPKVVPFISPDEVAGEPGASVETVETSPEDKDEFGL